MFDPKLQDRLKVWRTFRKKIDSADFESAVLQTVKFWSHAPFVPYYLDVGKPGDWPDPWDLVEENYYCDLAKALGILYTLYFTAHGPKHLWCLRIYQDTETKYVYNTIDVDDGKYVINLIDNELVNKQYLNESLVLTHEYNQVDLKLDQY
jgi:hypothetical protein